MTQQTQTMMHAAAIDQFGGAVTPHTLPVPQPGPDEILIRIEAAGVGVWGCTSNKDTLREMMEPKPTFPYVLGSEGAGTVANVGSKVSRFKTGDRVFAIALANPKGGFYAEYAAVAEGNASPIPKGLTVEQAAVMPVDALTALTGMDEKLHLKPGEKILIFGAGGGIGHMAVQLAKRMGASVFAVASGSDGVGLVKQPQRTTRSLTAAGEDIPRRGVSSPPAVSITPLLTAGSRATRRAPAALQAGERAAHPNGVERPPQIPALNRLPKL